MPLWNQLLAALPHDYIGAHDRCRLSHADIHKMAHSCAGRGLDRGADRHQVHVLELLSFRWIRMGCAHEVHEGVGAAHTRRVRRGIEGVADNDIGARQAAVAPTRIARAHAHCARARSAPG
jgi:hypothetical protein